MAKGPPKRSKSLDAVPGAGGNRRPHPRPTRSAFDNSTRSQASSSHNSKGSSSQQRPNGRGRPSNNKKRPPPRAKSFDRPTTMRPHEGQGPPQHPQHPQRGGPGAGPPRRGAPRRARSWDGALRRSFRRGNNKNNNSNKNDGPTKAPPSRHPSNGSMPGGGRYGGGMSKFGQSMRRLRPHQRYERAEEVVFWTWWRIGGYCVPLTLILVCSIGLVFLNGNISKLTDFAEKVGNRIAPELDNNNYQDQFAGKTLADVPRWPSNGNGLELEFLNACEDKWLYIYTIALSNWDLGSPDSLTLTTQNVPHDPECSPVDGKVKVCSGDYGQTNWRGINTALLDPGNIIKSSASQMNEFYLVDGDDESGAKRYTMCHEMGHALGLPHTDEDFNNEDLGNCLDYTNNFKRNENPDASNYEALLELYGAVGVRKRRNLRRPPTTSMGQPIPDHVRANFRQVVSQLDTLFRDDAPQQGRRKDQQEQHLGGWRVLNESDDGHEHTLDLGDGYKALVQRVAVNPNKG